MRLTPRRWTWAGSAVDISGKDHRDQSLPELWLGTLTQDAAWQAFLLSVLSPDERMRCERFHLRADQQRFAIGRGLLRLLLGARLNISARQIAFEYGPFGKPRLVPHGHSPELFFNVSHSGEIVIVALSACHEVGVDVELERPEAEWKDIANQVFSPAERRSWNALAPAARSHAFFQAWTRREAGLKALGLGFSNGTTGASADVLQLFDLNLPLGYQGAVAMLTGHAATADR